MGYRIHQRIYSRIKYADAPDIFKDAPDTLARTLREYTNNLENSIVYDEDGNYKESWELAISDLLIAIYNLNKKQPDEEVCSVYGDVVTSSMMIQWIKNRIELNKQHSINLDYPDKVILDWWDGN